MEANDHKIIFISGNTDLEEKKFITYYLPVLTELAKDPNTLFALSDDAGCAEMCQVYLNQVLEDKTRVTVYCVGNKPTNYLNGEFVLVSDFVTKEERDAAMTAISNMDFHIILSGHGKTACGHNIIRRNSPEYDFLKYLLKGNTMFWNTLFLKLEEKNETNA